MSAPHAVFLDAPHSADQRYALLHRPVGPLRGRVLYLPPFAEEMNKSRRMAALQARAMAEAGYAVLQLDLQGCGDSDGDFADASWQGWIQDCLLGLKYLNAQVGAEAPLTLWGLRAGCLLAPALAEALSEPCHFLLWQPSTQGKLVLQQFIRLKTAAAMMDGQQKGMAEQVRQALAQGECVEIAGYRLPPALAQGLEAASLKPPQRKGDGEARLAWIEISRTAPELSPASQTMSQQWANAGYRLQSAVVAGPAFWQTTEIEDAPDLLPTTLELMA